MSRLADLIAQAKTKDPPLGADLDREFKVLSERLPFGLNFERHRPEAVELPQRPIRKDDKVRVLPPRGSTKMCDLRLGPCSNTRRDPCSRCDVARIDASTASIELGAGPVPAGAKYLGAFDYARGLGWKFLSPSESPEQPLVATGG